MAIDGLDKAVIPPKINWAKPGEEVEEDRCLWDDPEVRAAYMHNAKLMKKKRRVVSWGWHKAKHGVGGATCPFCKRLISFREDPDHLSHCEARVSQPRPKGGKAPADHTFIPYYDPALGQYFETAAEKKAFLRANGLIEAG